MLRYSQITRQVYVLPRKVRQRTQKDSLGDSLIAAPKLSFVHWFFLQVRIATFENGCAISLLVQHSFRPFQRLEWTRLVTSLYIIIDIRISRIHPHLQTVTGLRLRVDNKRTLPVIIST